MAARQTTVLPSTTMSLTMALWPISHHSGPPVDTVPSTPSAQEPEDSGATTELSCSFAMEKGDNRHAPVTFHFHKDARSPPFPEPSNPGPPSRKAADYSVDSTKKRPTGRRKLSVPATDVNRSDCSAHFSVRFDLFRSALVSPVIPCPSPQPSNKKRVRWDSMRLGSHMCPVSSPSAAGDQKHSPPDQSEDIAASTPLRPSHRMAPARLSRHHGLDGADSGETRRSSSGTSRLPIDHLLGNQLPHRPSCQRTTWLWPHCAICLGKGLSQAF